MTVCGCTYSARDNVRTPDNFRSIESIVRSMSHVDGQNVRAKVEAQRRSTIFPHQKKRDVSLAIFSISGRYPLHAEGVSVIRAQMQKRLSSYVRVCVATA